MRPQYADRFRNFLDRCSKNFPYVIYVAGNHEHYHGTWYGSLDHLREECSYWHNIYFLDKDVKVIDDYAFLGCTLWTDLNKGDPSTMYMITNLLNDHRLIRNDKQGYSRIRAIDTLQRHKEHVEWLRETIPQYENVIVVGHMGPTHKSIHPRYAHDYHTNGGYCSDLSDLILDNPNIRQIGRAHV